MALTIMDDFLLRIYLEQAKQECQLAFQAIEQLNDAIASKGAKDPFGPAQAMVHHAAAVSRIFWPPGGKNKTARQRSQSRGEALRKAIGVRHGHPVQNRTLRDHFEHFDERLDDWAEKSKNRNIVKQLVGPRSAIGGDAITDEDIIHHYDPATKVYAFRGEQFDVQELASGLDDINRLIEQKLNELWPHNQVGR
ncbi:hypothetical protein [Marinobacter shengliensis]|uniref:hypothetical protein n=1 Tax=Marinobacter shengliensis TaxID=1389223 RepID=UPI0011088EC5|nr:hypothetical protein [Marinobacter shengliensis]